MSDKHSTDNPLAQLWVAMSGASAGHPEPPPGLDGKSVAVGHEPDRFGVGGIVAVPVAVFLTLVLTYVVVTSMFGYVNGNASDPIASKDMPLNNRLGRTDSAGGKMMPGMTGQPSGEPRLDGLPMLDTRVNGKDVAPYLMSFRKTPSGNGPDIYPEDLRADKYTDPETQKQPLADPAERLANDKYARIPISAAIAELLKNDALKKQYTPVSDTPLDPSKTWNRAKPSNGGAKK